MDPETDLEPGSLTLGRSLWAIRPEVLPYLTHPNRASGALRSLAARASADTPKARLVAGDNERVGGSVAVIPLTGVITPTGGSLMSFLFGGYGGLQEFRGQLRDALANPEIASIVIDVDSPGGLYDLVPETAQELYDARGTKPITAVANTQAASAAYFIASQADEFVVTPSGNVGSIGTYMLHQDWSGWNTQQGILPTYIFGADGPFKVDGNMDEPLTDTARADMQQQVDDITDVFIAAVARGRNVSTAQVAANYGQGRVLLADRALASGMVDRVDTLDNVIRGMLTSSIGAGPAVKSRPFAPRAAAVRTEVPTPPAGDETDPRVDAPVEPTPPIVEASEPVEEPDVSTHEPDEAPDLPDPEPVVEPDGAPVDHDDLRAGADVTFA